MIDVRKLFRSGRRYRGFAPFEDVYTPVTFNLYPVGDKEVRIRYLLPLRVFEDLREGDIIYALIENEKNLIAEIRIKRKENRSFEAEVDFVTEDRRKLPRVRLKGILDVQVESRCGGRTDRGSLIDISLSSLSVDRELPEGDCELYLSYKNKKVKVYGKVVRSGPDGSAIEIMEGNGEMTDLLGRIYSDLFMKVQRS